jgi:predicted DNA-binding transcriptional regulator YafY
MALNKNALIRYKTIDKCLQNRYRAWTLDDLIEACSEALYEYEGRDVNVSKRTVQLDIQMMRSDKLGYNAPIVVYNRKYYTYENEDYSITDIPLTENDMNVLTETVEMLKQFKDFSLFSELGGIIQKLEDKVYTERTHQAPVIHLDKNEFLQGLEHLDVLYQAIIKKVVLKINYKSFRAREASVLTFHPFILKEFNNRWFLIGKTSVEKPVVNLALDRILSIEYDLKTPYLDESFNGDEYYKNTIGVTVLNDAQLQEVIFRVDNYNAPYILTKPFHASQEVLEMTDEGVIFKIKVHLNFELERLILGFGDSIEVIAPGRLRNRILKKLKRSLEAYDANQEEND